MPKKHIINFFGRKVVEKNFVFTQGIVKVCKGISAY